MQRVSLIFDRIQKLTHEEGQIECGLIFVNKEMNNETTNYSALQTFLRKIFDEIDSLGSEIELDSTILISVKNQKLLRTCYQIVTCFGISPCLLPGLGISLTKRSSQANILSNQDFTPEQKYELLVQCVDFFTRTYKIPVLKNIINTLHLCDYLAALIQLSFAPLKKPGTSNMTTDLYYKLNKDTEKFCRIYENLVNNCFQPLLMKELIVLLSETNPCPPKFAKKVITKEMSKRLLYPGGLLSLYRCLIESYNIDVGLEWKKIDLISRIVSAKHYLSVDGVTEDDSLTNICAQLNKILVSNNTHYLTIAVACVLRLKQEYPKNVFIHNLEKEIFYAFHYDTISCKAELPGTILLTAQEIDHKINILHATVSISQLLLPWNLLKHNLYVLYLIGMASNKNSDLSQKLNNIVIKILEHLDKDELFIELHKMLFGNCAKNQNFSVQEFDAGSSIKCVIKGSSEHSKELALKYFCEILKLSSEPSLIKKVLQMLLNLLSDLNLKRHQSNNTREVLLVDDDEPVLITEIDEQYATVLQLLSEIATTPKAVNILKSDPSIIMNFLETFILKNTKQDDECTTIALVLLNTVLSNHDREKHLEKSLVNLIPVLKKLAKNESSMNSILCKEALNLINSETFKLPDSLCEKAINDIFDNLLPVRAHGIIEITKLIRAKDPETISKKHYVFCLLQEQVKDADSYIYLAAINAIAELGTHCTEDVLQFLCKEFLDVSMSQKYAETSEAQDKISEVRMKIGDIIVKVTRGLGEMAIVYKNVLLNTVLCGCRDEDPLIRTSALSNMAEIALVLNYKIGTIIYEVLLCVWGILETDKAIECRRAAVMVISSLLKGLGKDTLFQLKDNLLPVYRTLKHLNSDWNEDDTVRLHAQIGLEELNSIVHEALFPEVNLEKNIFVLDQPPDLLK